MNGRKVSPPPVALGATSTYPDYSLSLYDPSLALRLFRILDANREHLDPWMELPRLAPTVASYRNYLVELEDRQRKGQVVGGTIIYKGEIVGDARLDGYDWDYAGHAVGLTYWVAEGFQGRGIVTRACRELVTRAFATPGVRRVEVSVATHNHRSRRLAERLGFQLEGVLRSELKQGDDICDLAVYSLLAHEWQRPLDHGTLPQ